MSPWELPNFSDLRQVRHPRSRIFSEALFDLCRDDRALPPLLKVLLHPAGTAAERWAALQSLAESIPGSSAKSLAEGATLNGAFAATLAFAMGRWAPVLNGHEAMWRIAEIDRRRQLSDKAFRWCAVIDADRIAQDSVRGLTSTEPVEILG